MAGFTQAVRFLSTGFSLGVTVGFSRADAAMCHKSFNERLPKFGPTPFCLSASITCKCWETSEGYRLRLSHQNSFPLMKKPIPAQFGNLLLPGRCDSMRSERWMAHAVHSTASIAGGTGARGEERETHMESVTYRD